MSASSAIRVFRLFPLEIPMKKAFRHAARERRIAEPLIVEVELADGTLGHGETLPRDYVSGETVDGAIQTIANTLVPKLLSFHPASFTDALEKIDALPMRDRDGQVITAARAGVELALLDAYSRHFRKRISDVAGWLDLSGLSGPASIDKVRYTGVVSGDQLKRIPWSIRKMRWFGLTDFKLKVGYDDDIERVRLAARTIGSQLGEHLTLRLDANGGWTYERAAECLAQLKDVPIACVEQPLRKSAHKPLVQLSSEFEVPLMADESLVTPEDAQMLIDDRAVEWFNIRLSKNGGLLPALRLVHLAARHKIGTQLGCMVGETSVLSAAGRRFLEMAPRVRFAEGSYGPFLLRGDVTGRRVGFGYGGRPKRLPDQGWGITIDRRKLYHWAPEGAITLPL